MGACRRWSRAFGRHRAGARYPVFFMAEATPVTVWAMRS
jgi:hypothetical protein